MRLTKIEETQTVEPRYRRPITRDRFDEVPKISRVGAHRAVEKVGSRGMRFVFALLATLILTAAGILLVMMQPKSVSFMDELVKDGAPVATPVVIEAEVDSGTSIIVLNGTAHENLALDIDEIIVDEGWGSTLFSGDAENRDVEISAIFYSDPADAGLAKGLGENLGGISFYESDQFASYGTQLTVLIGNDYAGPGARDTEPAE